MKRGQNIFLIATFFSIQLIAQSIYFNRLTTESGLSNNNVLDIIQDKTGYIWLATDDGLNRFDGYDFKVFRNDPMNDNSISDNSVWAIMEDKKGNIWLGTKGGWVNRFNPITEKFSKWKIRTEEVKENAITCIYEDSEQKIWIGTYRQGMFRLDPSSGHIDHWYNNPFDKSSLSNDYISSIVEDSRGNFWISTYFGLNKLTPRISATTFTHYHKFEFLSDDIVWHLTKSEIDPNTIWIGTANGLTRYDAETEKFSHIKIPNPDGIQFGNSSGKVLEEYINGQKILWIDSFAGLIRLNIDKGTVKRFVEDKTNPKSIASNQIHRIFRDHSGILWLATDKGLSSYSSKSNKFNYQFNEKFNLQNPSELSNKNIKAIFITEDNITWFGTDEGLYRSIEMNGEITIKKIKQTETLNIWSLTSDHSGNLWIGTYGSGLFKLSRKNGRLKNIRMFEQWINTQSIKFNKVVYCDSENKIWIGYWGFGLARLDPLTGNYKGWLHDPDNPFSISYEDIWSIHQDKKSRIWIGTDGGGLNLFDESGGEKFYRWSAGESGGENLSSNSIYVICESTQLYNNEAEVVLWLGTNNGLNKFVVKKSAVQKKSSKPEVIVSYYTIEHGLADNSIRSIVEDDDGNLWLGTSSGISFFDTRKNKFTNFSKSDGVLGADINLSSAEKNKDGLIFIGSNEGLNYFFPTDIKLSSFESPVVLTDFQIFNKSIQISEESPLKTSLINANEISLSYSDNVFSFQFAALDYSSPKSILYAYMMEGFDNDWIQSGTRRFVTYTNLNPGNYIFKVKATNSDGIWSDNIKSLKVIIQPPWWQTPWAIGLYALVFVLGVWGIIKFQSYRHRLQQELKMQEFEAHHLREIEKMKSRFFTNLSHEFRTPLTLIKGPLENLISGKIKENLSDYYKMLLRNTEKLQNLIDQLLELSQLEAETIPLNKKQSELISLVRGFTYSFLPLAEQKFITLSFSSTVESLSSMIDRDKLEKIINNLLSNAFKFTTEGGRIDVGISLEGLSEPFYALISISDSGIGIPKEHQSKIFDRFYRIEKNSKGNEAGSGIGLALVKELAELHNWEISVKSEEGTGTTFTLKIPVEIVELTGSMNIEHSLKESKASEKIEIDLIDDNVTEKENINDSVERSKPSILFVEDSPDVRSYVQDLLKPDYEVTLAERVEEGLKLALNNTPDLIISDLMMPGMDGIEFCNKIKSNWQTSHIPFILLTAKVTDDSKLQGLETGADDYLTKPFNFDELVVRIKNLIEQRKRLREKFSKEINIQPDSFTSSKVDSEFLQKVILLVEKNLSNEKFDTEFLAQEMFVSRRQLHRKLLAVSGQRPGEFIRVFRLKRAAQMLIESKLSVTQIALEVGFESPAQFTRAFKKHFNVLPSEFNKHYRNNFGSPII